MGIKFKRFMPMFVTLILLFSACNTNPPTKTEENKLTAVSNEWAESAPEQQGVDEQVLLKADDHIRAEFPNIYSFVMIKNGYLVHEKYYQEKKREDLVHTFSVTKSVTASLIGIAIREGYITSLDQKLAEFFPEFFSTVDDPKKKDITLRQALTMTAGFKPAETNFYDWFRSSSWFEYTIKQPLVSKPGERFNYDTGLSHLLSGVISKATQMSTLEFAEKFLFSQIGIEKKLWGTDNQGNFGGGHLLNLTPRDMAKFGYLYLKNGNWKGQQVIPSEWVKESTQRKVSFDKDSGYGYLWWLYNKADKQKNRSCTVYSALGFGGQRIDVIPELDIVAVITADPDKSAKNNSDTGEILTRFVIPSVK
ncbi:MAG: beta-lactamase family protein [Clostridia bacterium]|nr:beta-lactamase family protein [Clostridia bacterium]